MDTSTREMQISSDVQSIMQTINALPGRVYYLCYSLCVASETGVPVVRMLYTIHVMCS